MLPYGPPNTVKSLRRRIAAAGLLGTLVLTACSSGWPVEYGQGVYAPETGSDGSIYRWMGADGQILLPVQPRPMRLFLELGVPLESFPEKPLIRIELNGTLLEEWSSPPAVIEKEYEIPQARQGAGRTVELRIRTSRTFVPHQVNGVSADERQLGVVLRAVLWRAK